VSLPGTDFDREREWREIERHLEGARTILGLGATAGAFSIPVGRAAST
jgi:hypothetical protein